MYISSKKNRLLTLCFDAGMNLLLHRSSLTFISHPPSINHHLWAHVRMPRDSSRQYAVHQRLKSACASANCILYKMFAYICISAFALPKSRVERSKAAPRDLVLLESLSFGKIKETKRRPRFSDQAVSIRTCITPAWQNLPPRKETKNRKGLNSQETGKPNERKRERERG